MRILGIDPGSTITGFGVIDYRDGRLQHVEHGTIRCGSGEMIGRLELIYTGVRDLIARVGPSQLALERAFVSRNPDSAIKLGQARAAALCGSFGAELAAFDYSPSEVKKAVVGTGKADKAQVQHMVRQLLALAEAPPEDAADALAVAICHAHSSDLKAKLSLAMRKRSRRGGRRP